MIILFGHCRYVVHARVRIVAEADVSVPLSVVVRGEDDEGALLLTVSKSNGRSHGAIQASGTFTCTRPIGALRSVELGDWGGMVGQSPVDGPNGTSVQVYIEHVEVTSEAGPAMRSRCHAHTWVPRAEVVYARPESIDRRLIRVPALSTDPSPTGAAARVWMIRIATADSRAAAALRATRWRRETPTVTCVMVVSVT
eukprot:COSAG01_NODE_2211_length_8159_cov_5.379032_2_plen_197_part_00